VIPSMQGRGYARAILAELERTAGAEGHRRMVLSTGARQVAAIDLYLSSGYARVAPFGMYRNGDMVRCFVKPLVD
jgi:GNAT superfamily N-acetyltransferase